MARLNLVDRDPLFPRRAFERTFEARLAAGSDRQACITAVGVLSRAHERGCEAERAEVLAADLEAGRRPDLPALRERFQRTGAAVTGVVVARVPLSVYDDLGHPGAAA